MTERHIASFSDDKKKYDVLEQGPRKNLYDFQPEQKEIPPTVKIFISNTEHRFFISKRSQITCNPELPYKHSL